MFLVFSELGTRLFLLLSLGRIGFSRLCSFFRKLNLRAIRGSDGTISLLFVVPGNTTLCQQHSSQSFASDTTYSSSSSSSSSGSSYSGPIRFLVLARINSWRRSRYLMWKRPSLAAKCRPCKLLPAPFGPRMSTRIGGGCDRIEYRKTLFLAQNIINVFGNTLTVKGWSFGRNFPGFSMKSSRASGVDK